MIREMVRGALLSLLFAASQAEPPTRPSKDLDPKDAQSVAAHVLFNTRAQKSYESKFKSRVQFPMSDAIDYEGRGLWASPAVVFVHYTSTGGGDKKIVRAGDEAWVHHSQLRFWTSDGEAGMSGAGQGIQNPDEILAVLGRHIRTATFTEPGALQITLSGADIAKITKDFALPANINWKESCATVTVRADSDHRLRRLDCAAMLKSPAGDTRYTSQVEVIAYNATRELKFEDDNRRPILLTKPMRDSLDKVMSGKR